jgi:xanthine dehydrogenase accessory factor
MTTQPWLVDLQRLLAHGDAVVLVTVAQVEGSAPREPGTKMIVTRESALHTIGGGHLEWRAIEIARTVLREGMHTPQAARRLERLALGPSLGQCCGGAVVLAFERLDVRDMGWVATLAKRALAGEPSVRSVSFGPSPEPVRVGDAPDACAGHPTCTLSSDESQGEASTRLTETIAAREFAVVLVGAGHAGAALAQVLSTLPCHVRWVGEPNAPSAAPARASLVANVSIETDTRPEQAIDAAAPGSCFVVMTQQPARDFALAERILRRGDFAFFGMIGSRTKRREFEQRLTALGFDADTIARMQCPIGIDGIADKSPEVIAISAAAQLLQAVEAMHAHKTP